MQTRTSPFRSWAARRAFSLIELMTAVSIMLVIIFALYAMFNQTQKALRANITQVDVLESGRAAADMLGRELEQLTACHLSQTTNFYVGISQNLPFTLHDLDQNASRALRTNIIHDFFFLSRQGNQWVGTGYRVRSGLSRDAEPVGTLYRMMVSTNFYGLNFTNLMGPFVNAPLDGVHPVTKQAYFHRVADGIVHLRLTAYDPAGRQLHFDSTNMYPSYAILRLNRSGGRLGAFSTATAENANVVLREDPNDPYRTQTQLSFKSNALPGYIELELGILEPTTLKQYQSLRDSPAVAAAFLKKQAAKVHLFRQRIPIRTVLQ